MAHPAVARKAVEYYAIELSQLADGTMHVHMTAVTVDDEDPQLLSQDVVTERVSSIDYALALIKDGVKRTEMPPV